ncbi:hypothetical protein SLS60_002220 [Paraconiothyrium brasiliense]|uniref:C3H1-type domain-containing protein n=1 Tax=Paraconiothyrium brasiliense TaxID=300254 RepID=A0ABR3S1I8_9PLEO
MASQRKPCHNERGRDPRLDRPTHTFITPGLTPQMQNPTSQKLALGIITQSSFQRGSEQWHTEGGQMETIGSSVQQIGVLPTPTTPNASGNRTFSSYCGSSLTPSYGGFARPHAPSTTGYEVLDPSRVSPSTTGCEGVYPSNLQATGLGLPLTPYMTNGVVTSLPSFISPLGKSGNDTERSPTSGILEENHKIELYKKTQKKWKTCRFWADRTCRAYLAGVKCEYNHPEEGEGYEDDEKAKKDLQCHKLPVDWLTPAGPPAPGFAEKLRIGDIVRIPDVDEVINDRYDRNDPAFIPSKQGLLYRKPTCRVITSFQGPIGDCISYRMTAKDILQWPDSAPHYVCVQYPNRGLNNYTSYASVAVDYFSRSPPPQSHICLFKPKSLRPNSKWEVLGRICSDGMGHLVSVLIKYTNDNYEAGLTQRGLTNPRQPVIRGFCACTTSHPDGRFSMMPDAPEALNLLASVGEEITGAPLGTTLFKSGMRTLTSRLFTTPESSGNSSDHGQSLANLRPVAVTTIQSHNERVSAERLGDSSSKDLYQEPFASDQTLKRKRKGIDSPPSSHTLSKPKKYKLTYPHTGPITAELVAAGEVDIVQAGSTWCETRSRKIVLKNMSVEEREGLEKRRSQLVLQKSTIDETIQRLDKKHKEACKAYDADSKKPGDAASVAGSTDYDGLSTLRGLEMELKIIAIFLGAHNSEWLYDDERELLNDLNIRYE